jgi:hypothetical protein
MKCAPWLLGSLTVALIAGCGGDRRNNDNSAAGTGTETGTMQGGAATTDTAMSSGDTSGMSQGMSSDTAHADAGMHGDMDRSSTTSGNQSSSTGAAATGGTGSDSAKGNQTKSGVTNTKTGKSTLGKGVTKTRPDQGQPVTSKGDTVSSGPDSTGGNQ